MDFTTARRLSVPLENKEKRVDLQTRLVALASSERRREEATGLARLLGAEELLLFIPEPGLDVLLPAPGFPQTLPEGREWRLFLSECLTAGRHKSLLFFPDRTTKKKAVGFSIPGGGVLALLGGNPTEEVEALLPLFPLLISAIRGERAALAFTGQTQIAQSSVAEARRLAEALDAARHKVEEALAKAQAASRIKSQVVSVVSHELRTPLNAIIGYTALLKDSEWGAGGMSSEEMLDRIRHNALNLLDLINNLLDLGKIEAGKVGLHVKEVSLSHLLKGIIYNFEPMAQEKKLKLEFIDDPTGPEIQSDPGRLKQIFINLVSNAMKFTNAGSVKVRLKHDPVEKEIRVEISDTGVGIKPNDLSFIFEPFYQSDPSNTRMHEGTGLGLSIVKKLLDLLGGKVEVTTQLQVGATFIVYLPYLPPDQSLEPRQALV